MSLQPHDRNAVLVGIGLKSMHLAQILGGPRVDLDFFEVHAENYMSAGGPMLERLERIRERHALSIHGVGLSIGGPDALDTAHLARLKRLLQRFEPRWFSEHLAWSSHGGHFFNDLLPLPYTEATLARVCAHVDQVQETLGRRLLLENPSPTWPSSRAASRRPISFLKCSTAPVAACCSMSTMSMSVPSITGAAPRPI